jgi:hypothetical protein
MEKSIQQRADHRGYSPEKTTKLSIMAIEHKRLGKHGVLVSNICLGTMNFGWQSMPSGRKYLVLRPLSHGNSTNRSLVDSPTSFVT